MNIVLWVVQLLLALLFVFWGFMLVVQPTGQQHGQWEAHFSAGQRRLIGLLLFLGGLGLVLPAWTGILIWLTPLAALGLAIFMGGVLIVQSVRRWDDRGTVIMLGVVLLLASFVAYGRYLMVPLS